MSGPEFNMTINEVILPSLRKRLAEAIHLLRQAEIHPDEICLIERLIEGADAAVMEHMTVKF